MIDFTPFQIEDDLQITPVTDASPDQISLAVGADNEAALVWVDEHFFDRRDISFIPLGPDGEPQTDTPITLYSLDNEDGSIRFLEIVYLSEDVFLIAWLEDFGAQDAVYYSTVTSDGSIIQDRIRVDDDLVDDIHTLDIEVLAGGNIVFGWSVSAVDGDNKAQILSQDVDSLGTLSAVGENFEINLASGSTSGVSFQALPDGDFLTFWNKRGGVNPRSDDIVSRRYSSDGDPLGLVHEFTNHSVDSHFAQQTTLGGIDNIFLGYVSDHTFDPPPDEGPVFERSLIVQLFGRSGNPLSHSIVLAQGEAVLLSPVNVVSLSDGGFLAYWPERTGESDLGVFDQAILVAQRFNSEGDQVGARFEIEFGLVNVTELAPLGVIVENGSLTFYIPELLVDELPSSNWHISRQTIIFNQELIGTSDLDELLGGAGNDDLTGGLGADVLDGDGHDRAFYIDLDEAALIDIREGTFSGGSADGDLVVNVEEYFGSRFADNLFGSLADETLRGQRGNDNLRGRGGDDTLYGGDHNDTLLGGLGNDQLFGEDGNDTLVGSDGNDRLTGGLGADTLDGGDGFDRVLYTDSDASVLIDVRDGTFSGGTAEGDTILNIENFFGSRFADNFFGSTGDDTLHGQRGADNLRGRAGDDELFGDDGNDTLIGGGGDDVLVGGANKDTFVFAGTWGDDVITDYTDGEDRLDFSASGLSFSDLTISQVNDDTLIEDAFGNSIKLQNTTATDITEADFLF